MTRCQFPNTRKTYFELALPEPFAGLAIHLRIRAEHSTTTVTDIYGTHANVLTTPTKQSRRASIHRNCALSTFTQSFQRPGRYHEQRSDVSPGSGRTKTKSSSMLMDRPGQWLQNVKQTEITKTKVSTVTREIGKFPGPASAALQRCGDSCARGARVAVSRGSVHGRATWQQCHLRI